MTLEVVLLAQELRVVVAGAQVQDLAGRELFGAGRAGEASQVVHLVSGLADVVLGQDALLAAAALGAEASVMKRDRNYV